MKFSSGSTISGMSIFLGVITSKVNNFLVMRNLCLPTFTGILYPREKPHSLEAIFIGCFAVCTVLAVCCLTQIDDSIVALIPINVINLEFWENFMNPKPSESMRGIGFPVVFYICIAFVFLQIASLITHVDFWPRRNPVKFTSFWVIRKVRDKLFMFHGLFMPDREMDCKCY